VRTLRKSPACTITAPATLAVAIGASTASFSVTNAVLLRPLPYPDADRLTRVFWENAARTTTASCLIPPGSAAVLNYEYWMRRYGGSTKILGQEMRCSVRDSAVRESLACWPRASGCIPPWRAD
jgi:hypothetical protein